MRKVPIGLIFILPAFFLIFFVILYPLCYSFWVSLCSYDIGGHEIFVGVANYIQIILDPATWQSVALSLYHYALVVIMSIFGGLGIALVLNEQFFGRDLVRAIIIIPWALSEIVCGLIWGWILHPTYGWLNGLLYALGLINEYKSWFGLGLQSITVVSIVKVWSVMPIASLLILSALQTIPEDLMDAAKIDGANKFQRFWHVTRPLISTTLVATLVIVSLYAGWTFGLIWILTGGGPGSWTTLLSWLGYRITFYYDKPGLGTCIFYLQSAITLILAFAYLKILRRGMVV